MHCVREIRYACEMRYGALGGFISFHIATKEQYFTIHAVNYFTFGTSRIFHLKNERYYDIITIIGGAAMKEIIESQITLLSQTHKISLPVKISYTDNEVEIILKYNNIEYCGTGRDYLWVDAFANLQRKLPHGIFLACCMTCRHGTMCPYGNKENQLYCTKDVKITSKDSVIELMDDKGHGSFFERAVSSIHCCDDFIYQSNDCYTYNDYLYHLQKN